MKASNNRGRVLVVDECRATGGGIADLTRAATRIGEVVNLIQAIAAQTVAEPPVPTVEELLAMPKPIVPSSIPVAYLELQTALDEYQTLVNDPQTAPNMGFQAALISYRHLNLPDAERRFKLTLDRFCGSDQAVKSKDALLAIYEALDEDEKFKSTNDAFIASKCGSEGDVALAVGAWVAMQSAQGQLLWKFIQGSRVELRKVVWPTREETVQTTIAVLVFATVMAVFFWLLDLFLLTFTQWIMSQGS